MRLDRGQIEVVDDQVAEILRRKTPAERIRIGFDIWLSASRMLHAYLKAAHGTWAEDEVNREAARRLARGAL